MDHKDPRMENIYEVNKPKAENTSEGIKKAQNGTRGDYENRRDGNKRESRWGHEKVKTLMPEGTEETRPKPEWLHNGDQTNHLKTTTGTPLRKMGQGQIPAGAKLRPWARAGNRGIMMPHEDQRTPERVNAIATSPGWDQGTTRPHERHPMKLDREGRTLKEPEQRTHEKTPRRKRIPANPLRRWEEPTGGRTGHELRRHKGRERTRDEGTGRGRIRSSDQGGNSA